MLHCIVDWAIPGVLRAKNYDRIFRRLTTPGSEQTVNIKDFCAFLSCFKEDEEPGIGLLEIVAFIDS
jgi:hypothetical protein